MAKKKFDYFKYFKEVSDIICEASEYLYKTLHNFNYKTLQTNMDTMHKIENRADFLKHDMTEILSHEFITPIEREDIVALSQDLDTVVDNLEDVVLRVYMFNVNEIKKEAVDFSEVIIKCAKELDSVIEEFKNFKNSKTIRKGIVAVNKYETQGDKILISGVRKLFTSDTSEKEMFIWTDIYEHLEICLDACEEVAEKISEVIMKNT